MRWDLHCDVLSKLITDSSLRFEDDDRLDVNAKRLHSGQIQLQGFAIFIPDSWKGRPFDAVLASIDAFQRDIASREDVLVIQSKADLQQLLQPNERRIGALLTLEGAEGLEGNFMYLQIAHKLGVRALGITWNHANWAADGVGEPRGGGFSEAGKKLIAACNSLRMALDVSHLSVKGFWELMELSEQPPFASHANAQAICRHRRNLSDEQIRALISRDGRIGITFVPYFLRDDGRQASVDDVLRHLEHICELGGVRHVGFGSDFDGIDEWTLGLETPQGYDLLENELLKRYTPDQVDGFMRRNWLSYFVNVM